MHTDDVLKRGWVSWWRKLYQVR